MSVVARSSGAATHRNILLLKAFQADTVHAAGVSVYRAHTAVDAAAQRAAITDWYYWVCQYDTLTDALANEPESP